MTDYLDVVDDKFIGENNHVRALLVDGFLDYFVSLYINEIRNGEDNYEPDCQDFKNYANSPQTYLGKIDLHHVDIGDGDRECNFQHHHIMLNIINKSNVKIFKEMREELVASMHILCHGKDKYEIDTKVRWCALITHKFMQRYLKYQNCEGTLKTLPPNKFPGWQLTRFTCVTNYDQNKIFDKDYQDLVKYAQDCLWEKDLKDQL